MKSSKKMQQIVTQIAKKHDFDLTSTSTHLRLEMKHMDPLVIEKLDQHLLSVAHYYMPKGIYLADPEIIFCTGTSQWVPIAVTQLMGGFRRYARLSADGDVSIVEPKLQQDLADFADQWAENIKAQAWLERGRCKEHMTPNFQRRFPLGRLLVTDGAKGALEQAGQDSSEFFIRHQAGDYGEIDKEDVSRNVENLEGLGGTIMSSYFLYTRTKIWVITDADWGRTTILLPEEY
jgi:hypothetical protein